jgi:hypothetical protein
MIFRFCLRLISVPLQYLGVAVRLATSVILVGVLMAGTFAYSLPAAAQPYDAGPVRQSHNPLSGENFQGGVDPSAFDNQTRQRQKSANTQDKGYLENLKDTVQGVLSGDTDTDQPAMAPADLGTDKNPTFKRYGTGPQ